MRRRRRIAGPRRAERDREHRLRAAVRRRRHRRGGQGRREGSRPGRVRRRGAGRDARHRADRRDGALARAFENRRESRTRRQAGPGGAADLPAAFPRRARWPPGHLRDAAQHRRQHARPRQRGDAIRDQGDGRVGQAEPHAGDGDQRTSIVSRHQHRVVAAGADDGDRAAGLGALERSGRDHPALPGGHDLRADRGDRFRQGAGAGLEMKAFVEIASGWILIVLLVGIPLYGWVRGVKVYEAFVEGAKEGFNVAVRIIPFLVAILAAVGAFRGAGAMDALAKVLAPITGPLGLPAEVLPMALVRPFSGSGALGLLGNIFATPGLGPDSYAGKLGSVLQGSTETTFYVLSVYCGSVGIVRYRHALAAGLLADFTGLTASVAIARMLWA